MQIDLPDDTERIEAARTLGHDLYQRSLLMPEAGWENPVLEGFYSAEARRLPRQNGDRFVRKWLQLRGNALRRKRIVDHQVTPALLMQIDVVDCPVLRLPLTHAEQTDTDWSVDRLNNDGAYVPRNLAIISTRANLSKADLQFDEVYDRARGIVPDLQLTPEEWMRIAVLMVGPCFVEQPTFAPILPLLAPLPLRTARSATQMIQYVLTTQTKIAADRNTVVKHFSRWCHDSHARVHCRQIAECIHFAMKETPVSWDVWQLPRVMRTFLHWRASVSERSWAALGEEAMVLAGGQRVSPNTLNAWHLKTSGHFEKSWQR